MEVLDTRFWVLVVTAAAVTAVSLWLPTRIALIWISLIFPADVEIRIDKRFWQEWPEGAKTRFMAAFGDLNPDPLDCSVKGAQDGSGGAPFEFRPTREGPFPVEYRVTGRVAKTGVSLSAETRRIVLDALKP
jgi:hypothetical protein